mmetsp:Transcript_16118/g.24079  ORF Transcript_16118/g.24079 Transcript_16118/m.24079 type:complete len:120 (+) Transcript_16118:633-992(+)
MHSGETSPLRQAALLPGLGLAIVKLGGIADFIKEFITIVSATDHNFRMFFVNSFVMLFFVLGLFKLVQTVPRKGRRDLDVTELAMTKRSEGESHLSLTLTTDASDDLFWSFGRVSEAPL